MVGTMLPIGYGERLQGRARRSLVAYAIGSVVGAGSLGLLVSALGGLIPVEGQDRLALALGVTGIVAVLYGLSDASLVRVPRPQAGWQVPTRWYRRFRPELTGLLYGVGLGVGLATRIQVSTFYLLPLWCLLTGNVAWSVFTLSMFGVGRFLPLLIIGTERGGDVQALESLIGKLEEFKPLVTFGNGIILTFVGAYLFATVWT
jgi:hypothetical protein